MFHYSRSKWMLFGLTILLMSYPLFTRTGSIRAEEEDVDLWSVSLQGLTISVVFSGEISTFVSEGSNLILVALLTSGSTWDASIVYLYQSDGNHTYYFHLGDPTTEYQFWIEGSADMIFSTGSSLEITFLESGSLVTSQSYVEAFALTTTMDISEFFTVYSQTISDYLDLTNPPSPTSIIIIPPSSSNPTSSQTTSGTSTSLPPAGINISDSTTTTTSSTQGLISSGFSFLSFFGVIIGLLIYRKRK
ncbi:MAG: hypothetical protein ACW99F_11940 [Candidatus Hodarchaeales archaeon]